MITILLKTIKNELRQNITGSDNEQTIKRTSNNANEIERNKNENIVTSIEMRVATKKMKRKSYVGYGRINNVDVLYT